MIFIEITKTKTKNQKAGADGRAVGRTKLKLIDYRRLTFASLRSGGEFNYLLYALFWPFFGIMFGTVERVWIREEYHPIYCSLDDNIPFCEYFLIPYLFWFVYLVGIHIYGLLFDSEAFRQLMVFIMVSYSIAIAVYLIYPNCQELRPTSFERDNIFTSFMAGFYKFDTNTNVCPSIHVIGSAATAACAWNSKYFSTWKWRLAFVIVALLISFSTVFLKQHSIIDIIAAVPVCVIAYAVAYRDKLFRKKCCE